MNYHVVIKAERRVSTPDKPRELALSINGQLHMMGISASDLTNLNYAASWDGVSPWIVVTAGKISDLTRAYAGWPMVDQATWEVAHPVVVL